MQPKLIGLIAAGWSLFAMSVAAEPLASTLVGEWRCQPKEEGVTTFNWVVTDNLPGGWLVGNGYENGDLTSVETWSFNSEGQLIDRRQFSPMGAFIHLSVIERSETTLLSSGTAELRNGESVPIRHRLHKIEADQFEATWEADEGDGWIVVADEVCTLAVL